ncbi:MAG: DUF4350 domain-containing protein [Cyanobacteria bacterium]|nr:DUF4350 domain-containing protein [Cyanobacteriota bacterium]
MMSKKNGFVFLLLLVGIMAVLMMTTFFSQQQKDGSEFLPNPTIFSNKASGYRGWYRTLEAAHLKVQPWRKSFDSLKEIGPDDSMVIIRPNLEYMRGTPKSLKELKQQETESPALDQSKDKDSETILNPQINQALLSWVGEGHHLVILDSDYQGPLRSLLIILGIKHPKSIETLVSKNSASKASSENKSRDKTPHHLSQKQNPPPIKEITYEKFYSPFEPLKKFVTLPLQSKETSRFPKEYMNQPESPSFRPAAILLDEYQNPCILRGRYGNGTITLGTLSDLGSNQFLISPKIDNYQFLVNLLTHPDLEGSSVNSSTFWINEYVHGFEELKSLTLYFDKTPVNSLYQQLLILGLLLIWLAYSRWHPIQRDTFVNQESPQLGFIRSLAFIYHRSQAAHYPVQLYSTEIQKLLKKRFQLEFDFTENLSPHHPKILLLQDCFADFQFKSPSNKTTQPVQSILSASKVMARKTRLSSRQFVQLVQQLIEIKDALTNGI